MPQWTMGRFTKFLLAPFIARKASSRSSEAQLYVPKSFPHPATVMQTPFFRKSTANLTQIALKNAIFVVIYPFPQASTQFFHKKPVEKPDKIRAIPHGVGRFRCFPHNLLTFNTFCQHFTQKTLIFCHFLPFAFLHASHGACCIIKAERRHKNAGIL